MAARLCDEAHTKTCTRKHFFRVEHLQHASAQHVGGRVYEKEEFFEQKKK